MSHHPAAAAAEAEAADGSKKMKRKERAADHRLRLASIFLMLANAIGSCCALSARNSLRQTSVAS